MRRAEKLYTRGARGAYKRKRDFHAHDAANTVVSIRLSQRELISLTAYFESRGREVLTRTDPVYYCIDEIISRMKSEGFEPLNLKEGEEAVELLLEREREGIESEIDLAAERYKALLEGDETEGGENL